MNILITLNKKREAYTGVMIASLCENNKDTDVYALYDAKQEKEQQFKRLEKQIEGFGGRLFLLAVDEALMKNIVGDSCDGSDPDMLLLLAHLYLPGDMERILYLSHDSVVTGDLSEMYEMDLNGALLAGGGRHYFLTNGLYCCIGARPEKGEVFDEGVMLINLPELRRCLKERDYAGIISDITDKKDINPGGIFNLAFHKRAVTLDPMKYNFRMDIYERYLRDGNPDRTFDPLIIRYVVYDYYRMNVERKTGYMRFGRSAQDLLTKFKPHRNLYELRPYWVKNDEIHKIWWDHAKKTGYYPGLKCAMAFRKPVYYSAGLGLQHPASSVKKYFRYRDMFPRFRQITDNDRSGMDVSCSGYTYSELEMYIDSLPAEEARKTMENLFAFNCERMQKKGKATVVFMVYSSSEWQCEMLYRMLEKDERYEPVIVIGKITQGSKETRDRAYANTCRYFMGSKLSYNAVGCYTDSGEDPAALEILKKADIFVYFRPGTDMEPGVYNFTERTLDQLIVHIPYGFYYNDRRAARYSNSYRFYDLIVLKMAWFYFCCDELQINLVKEQQRLGSYNTVFSGLPKLDILIEKKYDKRDALWKNAAKNVKKIIWAPHWLLGFNTGTFEKNYKWFYEYAKSHPLTSWIVRPHPRLPYGSTERYPVFKDLKEYDEYMESWEKLPNASVVPDGDYFDIFDSSDAMILDSISFLLEYQYTGKPLLVLLADTAPDRNELGKTLADTLYKAKGDDFGLIEEFIEDVVIGENDHMKEDRKRFFLTYLDYKTKNNELASELIYEEFTGSVFE